MVFPPYEISVFMKANRIRKRLLIAEDLSPKGCGKTGKIFCPSARIPTAKRFYGSGLVRVFGKSYMTRESAVAPRMHAFTRRWTKQRRPTFI